MDFVYKNQVPTNKSFTQMRNIDRLYGYLQVISKWDGKPSEPRYIHRKEFSSQEAAKELNVSCRTINRQILKLKEKGFVVEEDRKLKLPINNVFTTIYPDTLKYLYQLQMDNVITIYSFLRAMNWFFQDKGKVFFFTRAYLIEKVLGKTKGGASYDMIDTIIDLLTKLELVKFAKQTKQGKYNNYDIYAVVSVSEEIHRSEIPSIEDVFGFDNLPTEEEINANLNEYWQNKKD